MRKSSAGNKGKEQTETQIRRLLIIATGIIFIISLILSVWILWPSDKQLVEVVSDGEVLYTFDLSDVEDTKFIIEYGGSSNTIQIENGNIRVQEAECPDQTCVNMGNLRSESLPIVCLPNRLTIRFAE